jgi:hypothetical protein
MPNGKARNKKEAMEELLKHYQNFHRIGKKLLISFK